MARIEWKDHIKNYFIEDNLEEYKRLNPLPKDKDSRVAALRVWYHLPGENIKDTENHIVLYRQDSEPLHPKRVSFRLAGKNSVKTNRWLDSENYQITAPFDLKKKFRLWTKSRFNLKDKEWFFKFGVPHLLAIMLEKDFQHEIVGERKASTVFIL